MSTLNMTTLNEYPNMSTLNMTTLNEYPKYDHPKWVP